MSVRYLGYEQSVVTTGQTGQFWQIPDKSVYWLTFVGEAGIVALFKLAADTVDCAVKAMYSMA